MKTFRFDKTKHQFDEANKTISCNELTVPPFDTRYTVVNNKGKEKVFDLSGSTGSEWEPDTKWIYKSEDGWTLEVSQDAELTKKRAKAYLNHKLNRD